MYESAIKTILKENLEGEFNDRMLSIVNNATGLGWLHETLADLYYDYEELSIETK